MYNDYSEVFRSLDLIRHGTHERRPLWCHRLFALTSSDSSPKKTPQSSLSMSTGHSALGTPYHHTAWSNDDIYISPEFSHSLGDNSSTPTSPNTLLSSAFLSPDISFPGQNTTRAQIGAFSHDPGAYSQLQYQCRRVESKLLKEREENNNLRWVSYFLAC